MSAKNKFKNVTREHFQGGRKLSEALDGNLADILRLQRARQRGLIPSARIAFTVNPTDQDPSGIGGHNFKFVTNLAAATTFTQIKILGSAALTKAAFINAINGIADSNVVPATTPFAKPVVADSSITGVVRVQLADVQGGVAVPGASASIALTATITGGASGWDVANLNETGKELGDQDFAVIAFTVSATAKATGSKALELPFTPTKILPFNGNDAAAFSISSSTVTVAFDDGSGNDYYKSGDTVAALAFA